MEHSAGILAYRKRKGTDVTEFLLCSPSGPYWKNRKLYSFPKGHIENTDDSERMAAIREFYEETSFNLVDKINLLFDYKIIKQNANKTVHLYLYLDEHYEINADELKCLNKTKIEFPKKSNKYVYIDEVDSYTWMTYEEMQKVDYIKVYDEIYKNL